MMQDMIDGRDYNFQYLRCCKVRRLLASIMEAMLLPIVLETTSLFLTKVPYKDISEKKIFFIVANLLDLIATSSNANQGNPKIF